MPIQLLSCNLSLPGQLSILKIDFLFTGTIRADGSTRFGENNQYGYFPSVGFCVEYCAGRFHAEYRLFNNLKLRVGWGQTGNQEFPSGASLNRFGFGQQSISQSTMVMQI